MSLFRKKVKVEATVTETPNIKPSLDRFTIYSTHVNRKPITTGEAVKQGDEEIIDRTNWFCWHNTLSEYLLGDIYLVQKGAVWIADRESLKHDHNVVKWNLTTRTEEDINRLARDTTRASSMLVLFAPQVTLLPINYQAMQYTFGINFTVNHSDKAVTLELLQLRYQFVPTVNGLETHIGFGKEEYRLKLFSDSRANLLRLLKWRLRYCQEPVTSYIPDIVFDKLDKILKDFVIAEFGKDVCSDFKVYDLLSAFAVAYFPTEPRLFYFLKTLDFENVPKDVLQNIKLNYIDQVFKKDLNVFNNVFPNVPSSIRKYYLQDPFALIAYFVLKDYVGVTDINLIQKLIVGFSPVLSKNAYIDDPNLPVADCIRVGRQNTSCKDWIQVKPLYKCKNVYNILVTDLGCPTKKALRILFEDALKIHLAGIDWEDELRAFELNWDRFEKDSKTIKTLLRRGFCKETHDMLSREIALLGRRNLTFNLTDEQKERYEFTYKVKDTKYYFRLAEDTKRLLEIGNALNICVGSFDYDERVVLGLCLIAFVVEEINDKQNYIGCIEIRKDTCAIGSRIKASGAAHVHQARTYCNGDFKGDLEKIFQHWLQDCDLSFSGNQF